MKKFTTYLAILLVIAAVGFIICGIMLDWFTISDTVIEPTCTEQGYTLHRGWFGRESQVKPTAPLGHRYAVQTVAPTCTEGGSSTYTCAECGYSYVGTPTEPTGHHYMTRGIAPTCEEGGYTEYACTGCDHTYRDGETEPLGHTYISKVTPATCKTGGFTVHTCSVCANVKRDSETSPLGHDNMTEVIAPTCTAPGYTLTLCRRCADAAIVEPKEALGHNYLPYTTEPTCLTAGYTTMICSHCRDSYTKDHIEARGHDYKIETLTATTTHAGGKQHTCTRCGDEHMTDVYTFSEVFCGEGGEGRLLGEGVDLSYHNGEVDFKALKAAGISFVILRVGTSRTADSKFEEYYAAARAAGLDIGIYIYTYANTVQMALSDAAWVVSKLEGKTLEYPVFFDIEDNSLTSLSKAKLSDITMAFCDAMVDAGYYPGVYTNKRWMADHLEIDRIRGVYDIWLASWIVTGENIGDYSQDYVMWQYTSTGKVNGVSTDVDRNKVYRDYPALMLKYGYNGFSAS